MNKKTIGALFCFILITCSTIPVIGSDTPYNINLDDPEEITELILSNIDENETQNNTKFFITYGPTKQLISKIVFLKGSISEMLNANRFLKRKFLPLILPVRPVRIKEKSTFIIKYCTDIPLRKLTRNNYYGTHFGNFTNQSIDLQNNTNILNKEHIVKVDGFTGIIVVSRGHFSKGETNKFISGRYSFIGKCDNVTILPTLF